MWWEAVTIITSTCVIGTIIYLVIVYFLDSYRYKKKSMKELKDQLTLNDLKDVAIIKDCKEDENSVIDLAKFRNEILFKLEREKMNKYEEYNVSRERSFYVKGIDYAIKTILEQNTEMKQYFRIE